MSDKPNTQEVQEQAVEQEDVVVIDPFADDDTPDESTPKYDVLKDDGVKIAREKLGDAADTATWEEAMIELRKLGHDFYPIARKSERQRRRFGRAWRAAQPKAAGTSARISKQADLKDDLAGARDALSVARKATDRDALLAELLKVKELADSMIAKVNAEDSTEADEAA